MRGQISRSPFHHNFGEMTHHLLRSIQIFSCGLTVLGNCALIQSVAFKAILVSVGLFLTFVGADCILASLELSKLLTYPKFLKKPRIAALIDSMLENAYGISVFVKCWVFISAIESILFASSSFSIFSMTLLLVWSSAYLVLDFDFLEHSAFWKPLLESLLFCLNFIVVVWFKCFFSVPLFPE